MAREPSYMIPIEGRGHPRVQGHMPSANDGYLQAVPSDQPINRSFVGFYSNQGDHEMARIPPTDGGYIGHLGIHNEQPPPYEKLDNNQPIEAKHTTSEEKNDTENNTPGKNYEKLADNQPIGAMSSDQPIEARDTNYGEWITIKADMNDENFIGKASEQLADYQQKGGSNCVYAERKAYDNNAFENGLEEKNVDEQYLDQQTEK